MKYRCDMVRDLMPICLDHEATEASEQTVIEHMSECAECTQYYKALEKNIGPIDEHCAQDNKYVLLSARIRKRRIAVSLITLIAAWAFICGCLNYASGYRLTPQAAASQSGRLNSRSQELLHYEWKDDCVIYIYDSNTCYDVVSVNKTWRGWKCLGDISLIWPKESLFFDVGIEIAGNIRFFEQDEGIQLLPIIVYDDRIKAVEVSFYEKTQRVETNAGEAALFAFDASGTSSDTMEAAAYDTDGKVLYRLVDKETRYVWEPVNE